MNQQSLEQTLASNGRVVDFASPEALNRLCPGYIFYAYHSIAETAWDALTPFEQQLAGHFPDRRKNSFTAARIALKLLAYRMGSVDPDREAHTLETVNPTDRRPILPGAAGLCVSVSHDRHDVIAVADKRPIGVDLETVSPKIARGAHIFMNQEERAVMAASGKDEVTGAALAWTAKEAAAKALNLHLMDAWSAVRLNRLGMQESLFTYRGGPLKATHLFEGDRVISVVII